MQPLILDNCDLVFDMDDVLASFGETICSKMNQYGKSASILDYRTYEFNRYHDVSHADFMSIISTPSFFEDMPAKDGAIDALLQLAQKGFKIHIVTSRASFLNAHTETIKWFKNHDFEPDSITIMGNVKGAGKSFYYNQFLNKPAILVDDALHNIKDAIANAPSVVPIILNRPWNEDDEFINKLVADKKIHRIDSVSELVDCLVLPRQCQAEKSAYIAA